MGKLTLIGVILFVAQLLQPPQAQGKWLMDRFDWVPTESAHRNYPTSLIRGDLLLQDGSTLYVPSKRIIANGWGHLGSTHIVGNQFKPLPVRLTATWFSFAENKFFSGEFQLPYEELLRLFSRGTTHPSTGKKIPFYRIIVGFGPEGSISVWAEAQGEVVEVASFRGAETDANWNLVYSNADIPRLTYVDRVLKESLSEQQLGELKQHGVPSGISEAYRKKYYWSLSVTGCKRRMLRLRTVNGECESFDYEETPTSRTVRAIPKQIKLIWATRLGEKYVADIKFDEREAFAAYKRISGEKVDRPMQLHVEITEDPAVVHLYLKDSLYLYPFKKCDVSVSSL